MNRSNIVCALFLALSALGISSCVVHAHPVPPPTATVVVGPPVEYGYQPLLYDGYVVYYSHEGIPFYWIDGHRVWVPSHMRTRYITHYHNHRKAYVHWHAKRGHAYKTQRYRVKHHKVKHRKVHDPHYKKPRKAKRPRHKHDD